MGNEFEAEASPRRPEREEDRPDEGHLGRGKAAGATRPRRRDGPGRDRGAAALVRATAAGTALAGPSRSSRTFSNAARKCWCRSSRKASAPRARR